MLGIVGQPHHNMLQHDPTRLGRHVALKSCHRLAEAQQNKDRIHIPSKSNKDVRSHVSCVGAEVIGFRKPLWNDSFGLKVATKKCARTALIDKLIKITK